MYKMRAILDTLYELLFPREKHIVHCDTIDSATLESLISRTTIETPFFCIAPLPYKHPIVKNMIFAAKYHSHKHAAKTLGASIAPFVSEELAERQMFGTFIKPIFVAMPLHHKRKYERGYNQAERIGQEIVRMIDEKNTLTENILIRHKETLSQAHQKNKKERYKNMKNVFSVPNPELLRDKEVILIDDVVTTGATFSSARDTLLKAGAKEVLCVATAH